MQKQDKILQEIAIATNYEDIIRNDREGKISAVLAIEEGASIKGELYNLRNFYRLGVRAITLTWNEANEIGYSNFYEEYRDKGLTDLVVKLFMR